MISLFCASGAIAAPPPDSLFNYEPNPAIWRLKDADTTIYMMGTIHALPKNLKWKSKAIDNIIGEVDELVLETLSDEAEGKEAKTDYYDDAMIELMTKGLDRKPLADRVSPENRATLIEVAKSLSVPIDYLDLLPTWRMTFELFYNEADDDGVLPEYGVETVLEGIFKKDGKPMSGIENGDEVDARLNALTEDEQIVSLNQTLTQIRIAPANSLLPDKDDAAKSYAEDIEWAKGDLTHVGSDMSPATMGDAYYRALLVNRNAAWTDWLSKRMTRPGKMLLAVGAAHLAGKDAVNVMLEAKGFKVERIH